MAIDYIKLRDEINNDPEGLGYSGKTDQQVTDLMNGQTQPERVKSVSGSTLLDLTDWSINGGYKDDSLMTGNKRIEWLTLTSKPSIDLDKSTFQVIRSIFGGSNQNPSATEDNVDAARNILVSRSSQLGFGTVRVGEVTDARAK